MGCVQSGRLDQHLNPFYQAGLADGTLSRELKPRNCCTVSGSSSTTSRRRPRSASPRQRAAPTPTSPRSTPAASRPDGSDAVNDVTYLLLDVIEEMRLLQPSSSVQLSKKNPDRFIKRAAKIIRTGFGQPSIFNTDVVVQEMIRAGKSIEDARNGGTSGCVETGAFGKENYSLTGYFNMPKVLEITLHNGVDPRRATHRA
jgi:pyruvate-formate lyase